MELQRVPKNTLTCLEWPWCHQRNVKLFGVTKSTRDDAWLSCIGSSAITLSPSYKTAVLSYFRQLQRLPEIPVSNLKEQQFQHMKSRKARWTPYHLEKRADSQDSVDEVAQLSTSTSKVPFPQHYVWERVPEFAPSCRLDTEMLWLKRMSDFPAVAWMQARLSSHKIKRFMYPLCRT